VIGDASPQEHSTNRLAVLEVEGLDASPVVLVGRLTTEVEPTLQEAVGEVDVVVVGGVLAEACSGGRRESQEGDDVDE
jgi:hypothetical protein